MIHTKFNSYYKELVYIKAQKLLLVTITDECKIP